MAPVPRGLSREARSGHADRARVAPLRVPQGRSLARTSNRASVKTSMARPVRSERAPRRRSPKRLAKVREVAGRGAETLRRPQRERLQVPPFSRPRPRSEPTNEQGLLPGPHANALGASTSSATADRGRLSSTAPHSPPVGATRVARSDLPAWGPTTVVPRSTVGLPARVVGNSDVSELIEGPVW